MSTTSAVVPHVQPGSPVLVQPALGGSWIGKVCNPARTQGGDLVVQCLDPQAARGIVKGQVYAVLPRFASTTGRAPG